MFMRFERVSVALILALASLTLAASAMGANNPVPLINQPLVPDAVVPGSPAFTLTVNGTGFVSGSVVNLNGSPRDTTFVSKSQLTAKIKAADIANAGTASVTVVNPTPGGGTSNVTFLSITNSSSSAGFRLGSSPAGGGVAMVVGDFNGDGKLDLATASFSGNAVAILLGDGAGNFTVGSVFTTGSEPHSLAVGDFNGDGNLDLAVANSYSRSVSIFLGDGTGNFTPASSPPVGRGPLSIAVGDFNGDGNLDLAVAVGTDKVEIMLGDGTGNFSRIASPAAGNGPYSIAAGDFNGDGNLDLAVTDQLSDTVFILLGDGTGHFTHAQTVTVGSEPLSVAVGDFNGDGNLDLAAASMNDNTVSILLGDGMGHFTQAASPTTGNYPWPTAVGDFNGDGRPDVAVASADGTASILLQAPGASDFAFGQGHGGEADSGKPYIPSATRRHDQRRDECDAHERGQHGLYPNQH
jgi:hypothetical protein